MSAYGDHCDSRSADCVGAAQGIDLVQFLADGVGKDIVSDARDETDPHPTVRQTFLDLGLEGIHLKPEGLVPAARNGCQPTPQDEASTVISP